MEKVKTFVSNIPYVAGAEELVNVLEAAVGAGTVSRAEIQYNKIERRSMGKAVVHFEDQESAHEAAEAALSGRLRLHDRVLNLKLNNRDIVHWPKHSLITVEQGTLSMGCHIREDTMQVLWSSGPKVSTEFDFNSRRLRHALVVQGIKRMEYKLEFHFKDLCCIEATTIQRSGQFAFLLELQHPPRVFRRVLHATTDLDLDYSSADSYNMADPGRCMKKLLCYYKGDKEDPWVRTIDFTPSSSIGQSWTYLLECPSTLSIKMKNEISRRLADYQLCDYPIKSRNICLQAGVSNVTSHMLVPIVDTPPGMKIDFELMFKLNELVQLGNIVPANLTSRFYNLLQSHNIPLEYAKLALREIWRSEEVCWDPVKCFIGFVQKYQKHNLRIPLSGSIKVEGSLLSVHRLHISPTKVVCSGPEIELSNRVTREYVDEIDNFLRVSFVEEDWEAISARALSSGVGKDRSLLYDRMLSVMRQGVSLAGKKYEFLAFSSSQLREQSFWMFASTNQITVESIRAWMGDFLSIRNVARCAARMGQCFSSSTPTLEVPQDDVDHIPDVVRGDPRNCIMIYNFSDGIGKISKGLAEEVAHKCGFKRMRGDMMMPSAFQIRYGGYKGVVAVDPLSPYKLSLRPSMCKFSSTHIGLEVLSWSQFLPCYLNRQIISLLSTLSIPDAVFERMQECVVTQLNDMLHDPEVALEVLQATFSGDMHNTMTRMLEAGYHPEKEPYLKSMLGAVRAFQLLNLRTRSRIFVPQAALLMGCLDETAGLNYGEVFLQLTPAPGSRRLLDDRLGEFQGYYYGKDRNMVARVVTGKVVVAKNPCVHPGDIRVLQAVDVPGLRHMVNCLVFPQKGNRPHPNECSGSDLDGDLYFVSWDQSLIPPTMEEPMDYPPAPNRNLDHSVTVEELQHFFVDHLLNDNLGQISNAHLVHADSEPLMANSSKCKELAQRFAVAVDFPKTGIPANVPHYLRPKKYPDFMEKEDKVTYVSERIIGKLFRSVKEASNEKVSSLVMTPRNMITAYDCRLQVPGYEDYLEEAISYKNMYDMKLMGLMNQYGIETEAEVMSGNILRLSKHFRKRAGEVKQRIRLSVNLLKREARQWFLDSNEEEEKEEEEEDVWEVEQYAKASAWYHVTYHPDYFYGGDQFSVVRKQNVHLLSFPWVVVDVLLSIRATP